MLLETSGVVACGAPSGGAGQSTHGFLAGLVLLRGTLSFNIPINLPAIARAHAIAREFDLNLVQ